LQIKGASIVVRFFTFWLGYIEFGRNPVISYCGYVQSYTQTFRVRFLSRTPEVCFYCANIVICVFRRAGLSADDRRIAVQKSAKRLFSGIPDGSGGFPSPYRRFGWLVVSPVSL
jgi:hypothetical protein